MSYLIGIDVGTGSARSGVFSADGDMLGSATSEISLYRGPGSMVEQSSTQIWQAVCKATRAAIDQSGVAAKEVSGIGFTATGSLVTVGKDGARLAVGPSEDPERDVIVWMDLRSVPQSEIINATGHDRLKYVGGKISPELQLPKVLWLKQNRPATFEATWQFFDLTDYLTWRATKSLMRSTCTAACKWSYIGSENRWDSDFYREIGLAELADEGFERIGTEVVLPGTPLASGLDPVAAEGLGLIAGTPVGAGLVDAHAGGVGTLGAPDGKGTLTSRLSYILGTSGCTLSMSEDPHFVPGIWGPYYSGMVPGLWLNEGGQSAAGSAIDHLLTLHPAYSKAQRFAEQDDISLADWLTIRALESCETASNLVDIAGSVIVVPEFNGNRSPLSDPNSKAVISGIGFENDIDSLVGVYVAGICGLAYGLRQIMNAQSQNQLETDAIVICGGAGSSEAVRQIIADATGLPVAVPAASQPVLLGAAILGAVAAKIYSDIPTAMRSMSSFGSIVQPGSMYLQGVHSARFEAYCALQDAAKTFRPD